MYPWLTLKMPHWTEDDNQAFWFHGPLIPNNKVVNQMCLIWLTSSNACALAPFPSVCTCIQQRSKQWNYATFTKCIITLTCLHLEICLITVDESVPPNISYSLCLSLLLTSPSLWCSLLFPSPCSGSVYPQTPSLSLSYWGKDESRSIAPPEWILLWQAPPLPATAPATEHATLHLARDTPTLSLWLAPQPHTSASLEPHWLELLSHSVIGWAAGGLVSVGWLPWCPGRSVCT